MDDFDYPNEEELAEFQGLAYLPNTQSQNGPKTPNVPSDRYNSPASVNSFFQSNSQLSQIPVVDRTGDTNVNAQVNRRLFDTPAILSSTVNNRISSTPFGTALSANQLLARPSTNDNDNLRKRRLDQLFGDIDDIDDFVEEQQPQFDRNVFYSEDIEEQKRKKAKTEEEKDNQLIETILALRAINRSQTASATRQSRLEQLEALRRFKERNLSETYPKWPSQKISVDINEHLYVRMHSEEFETNQLKDIDVKKNSGNLLGDATDEIWNEAQAIVQRRMTATPAFETATANSTAVVLSEPAVIDSASSKLWVEKYKPKSYFDLLSDETTNHSLLTWLKMWDKMVFNREFHAEKNVKSIKPNAGSNFNKKTGKFEVGGVRFRKGRFNDLKSEIDSYGRPAQKIAVLCGPPGLGKTTLAHTIARHAGYAVREINASDDRSPESFRLALQNGTEMQTSIMNQERRPNCIILDEIDGAPIASIEFLVRFISDHPKEQSKSTGQQKPGAKKSKMAGILRRPIICICNDLYTPSLRPLRQVAFIVNFNNNLESSRLAERLLWIARRERLKTDMTTLLALIDKSGNDVRSCISVLQFFANTHRPLTLADVMSSNIGQKDRQKGLFDIWQAIFHIQKAKAGSLDPFKSTGNLKQLAIEMESNSITKRMDNILNVVHMGGDHDRLINGVYENYLSQKMPDANLQGVTEATKWFCFSDHLQTLIHSQQNYSVYPYLQYGFVAWHLLFSSMTWPKIVFPTQNFEFYQKSSMQQSIRQAFVKNISVAVRSLGNSNVIISDAISNIRQIICPGLRSVSLQLLTPKERTDLQHTVDVMADLGLTYAQIKSIEGTYQYQLEPDINNLCSFKEFNKGPDLTYSNMQIIAREVELEKMRRSAPKQSEQTSKQKAEKLKKQILANSNKPNHLQKLTTKPLNKSRMKDLVTKDFFGRVTEKQVKLSVQEGGTDQIVKSPVWYRYKEGFNNAVRKEVTMKSLI